MDYKKINKHIGIYIFWYWDHFGFSFLISKSTNYSLYKVNVDIQILWFNLYIQLFDSQQKDSYKKYLMDEDELLENTKKYE